MIDTSYDMMHMIVIVNYSTYDTLIKPARRASCKLLVKLEL